MYLGITFVTFCHLLAHTCNVSTNAEEDGSRRRNAVRTQSSRFGLDPFSVSRVACAQTFFLAGENNDVFPGCLCLGFIFYQVSSILRYMLVLFAHSYLFENGTAGHYSRVFVFFFSILFMEPVPVAQKARQPKRFGQNFEDCVGPTSSHTYHQKSIIH